FIERECRPKRTQRPAALNMAVSLLILASLVFWLATFLPGADREAGPPIVLYASVLRGVLGRGAAPGAFYLKGWGRWLSLGVSAFGALVGVGGRVYSTRGLGALLVALYTPVIVLMVSFVRASGAWGVVGWFALCRTWGAIGRHASSRVVGDTLSRHARVA